MLFIDIRRALRKPPSQRMDFQFSRYNMYRQRPGQYSFVMLPERYNLPQGQPLEVDFKISSSGYLDDIKPADIVLCGGSAAFGTGATSEAKNISGHLRAKYAYDVVNLAIPGYRVAQEVLTLIQHLDKLQAKTVILFHGTNDMALAFPFSYWGEPFHSDPLSFYSELEYSQVMNEYFSYDSGFKFTLQRFLLRASHRFVSFYWLHKIYSFLKPKRGISSALKPENSSAFFQERTESSFQEYKNWLEVLSSYCQRRSIRLIVALQPYHFYGHTKEEVLGKTKLRLNDQFDKAMVSSFVTYDGYLKAQSDITYCPIFKEFAKLDLNYFVDAVHLSDQGYEWVADRLHQELVKANEDRQNEDRQE